MAQPPAYNREKNFADDFGNETDHSALNAELDRASNSINDVRANLAILQADDGKLRPAVVTSDSISMELRTTLVEGVVMDAQAMLDRSLAAADSSSASALAAKASEERAASSSARAADSAEKAAESAKTLSLAINADWTATEGAAKILNRPELSEVAMTGNYGDLTGKPENLATVGDIADLQVEMAKRGTPVGSIEYFAMAIPPAGYLIANGAAVGRSTFPELFDAIGTIFGDGDGETTFNLPNLMDRFAQGSTTPGQKIEAGLPNVTGTIYTFGAVLPEGHDGVTYQDSALYPVFDPLPAATTWTGGVYPDNIGIDLSRNNPIYGASNTVQPPALTLLPCIKAFDAATNPGLIDITGLANDVTDLSANKLDKTSDGITVKYVTETFNDNTNWYRKWSDGWLEQGGKIPAGNGTYTFLVPFSDANYSIVTTGDYSFNGGDNHIRSISALNFVYQNIFTTIPFRFYACGQGA